MKTSKKNDIILITKWHIILVNTNYEDECKISLKSISMKLLVLAFYAQFRVSAGNEDFLGDHNGIWQPTQVIVETYLCEKKIILTN